MVKEIQVEGLASIEREELVYLLGLEEGRPIEEEDVTEGIKRAFLKGIFESISVEASDEREGLILVTVKEKDIVDDVRIAGNDLVSSRFIRKRLGVGEDDRVTAKVVDSIRTSLINDLRYKGFPDADVGVSLEREDDPYVVDVVVEVVEGEPLIVKRVEISGWDPEEAALIIEVERADVLDRFSIDEDLLKVEERLRNQGYIDPKAGPYSYEDGTLKVEIDPGEKLLVDMKGNKNLRSKKLLDLLPFYDARDVREDLVEESVSRITLLYHELGYPFIQVAPVVVREQGLITVDYYIFEGKKVLVESIQIEGSSIPPDRLKTIMTLEEVAAYSQEALTSDIQNLTEFYSALGYIDVSIAEPEVEIVGTWARVLIRVEEGVQHFYESISIVGAGSVTAEDLNKALGIKVGDPYNDVDLSDTRRALLGVCRDEGFLDCTVDVERSIDNGAVSIVFRVTEGERRFYGKTIVTGNSSTRHRVFEREIKYKEGEPFNYSLLTMTRQDLYKLNLFSSIDTKQLEARGDKVDLLVDVEEAKPGAVEFSLGYGQYEKLRGSLDISYRNLFGMNRRGSFRTEQSSLASRYILTYQEPWFLNRQVQSKSFLLYEELREKNIDTGATRYRLRRYTANTGLEKNITTNTKVGLYYEYSIVETFDVQPDVVLTREDTGTLGISSLSPSVVYDSRDNPFDPQKGLFTGLTVKVSAAELSSETDFVKGSLHGSTYFRLLKRVVLALAVKGGLAEGFRETRELPLVERFFLGGRNTVRGFDQDELGPKGALGTPTGGNAFALGNLEFRVRVTGAWRVVLFGDAGNVWVKAKDVDFSELRYTAGLGMQYNTPVGPIRLDYGHKIDRKEGESRGEVHFSIGHAF